MVLKHASSLTFHDTLVDNSNDDDNADNEDNVLLMISSHAMCGSSTSLKAANPQIPTQQHRAIIATLWNEFFLQDQTIALTNFQPYRSYPTRRNSVGHAARKESNSWRSVGTTVIARLERNLCHLPVRYVVHCPLGRIVTRSSVHL